MTNPTQKKTRSTDPNKPTQLRSGNKLSPIKTNKKKKNKKKKHASQKKNELQQKKKQNALKRNVLP